MGPSYIKFPRALPLTEGRISMPEHKAEERAKDYQELSTSTHNEANFI
jgi:hypothetical protein